MALVILYCLTFLIFRYYFHREMLEVAQNLQETQKFYENVNNNRNKVASEHKDLPPAFNKRLFASQGAVILTSESRRIMNTNKLIKPGEDPPVLSKSQLLAMRCVVDGLKLIHKGKDYVKDCLSHVITLESYEPFQYVTPKSHEECMSCYYIVNGAAEVTYDMRVAERLNVYQPNIIYSHGSGEYIGLVSAEGRSEELAPPATIYTKEACEFLRVDRTLFHKMIERELATQTQQKKDYLQHSKSAFASISNEAKEKIIPLLLKQVGTIN